MKKEVVEILDGVFLIENFISLDSCKFLTDTLNGYLTPTPEFNIYGGPCGKESSAVNTIGDYNKDKDHNISLDMFNLLLSSINETVCSLFNSEFKIKSSFYSAMLEGSSNSEHMDNYYLDGDVIKQRPNHPKDVSGLLYLSDDYEGGYLSFTSQNMKVKPKSGSLIIFEGDDKKPHEVTKVESGTRNLIVSFYVPVA